MLYHLALVLKEYVHACNVIHYVSFRIMSSFLTSILIFFLTGNWFIETSRRWFKSRAREYTPDTHLAKEGIPTMGGILMVGITVVTAFLWCDISHPAVWIFLLVLVGFGTIGFWDDWSKIVARRGINERTKFFAQVFVAALVMTLWLYMCSPSTTMCVPFFKNIQPDMAMGYVFWGIFLLVGTSNAVNLTDGLDGLAIGSLLPNFSLFSFLLYISGHALIAHYLHIPFSDMSEITIIGAALVGVSLGFLWYNAYPAQIFMGDVGSLALGGGLAMMALMSKQELLLCCTGGIFVIETVSVIAQVLSFKLRKKRLFRMAPVHHHFELVGWPESKITVRFTIITIMLCILSLMTLKLR